MQKQITDYLCTHSIDLAAIQETRVPETTHFMTAKRHFVLYGGEAKVEYASVGFVMQHGQSALDWR
eukprot:8987772-Alexandrium_andersonii.AAC.1